MISGDFDAWLRLLDASGTQLTFNDDNGVSTNARIDYRATRTDTYRLSAVARVAALYEKRKDYPRAVAAYRDIAQNATDRELAAAAADRASQLAGPAKR